MFAFIHAKHSPTKLYQCACTVLLSNHDQSINQFILIFQQALKILQALTKGIKKNKEGERRTKGIAMAQWVNRLRNNIFVNLPPLPLSCEISRALHLAQPGLMAGRLADEIQVNFKIFKIGCRLKYLSFCFV